MTSIPPQLNTTQQQARNQSGNLNRNNRPQRQKVEKDDKVDEALINLNDKLDAFEQETLDKKKIEMYEITKQKVLAMRNSIEAHFMNDPHLIGSLPGVENQCAIAFDCWLNKYKHVIKDNKMIKGNMELIIDQLCVFRVFKTLPKTQTKFCTVCTLLDTFLK